MNANELLAQLKQDTWTLQTWHNGKQRLGIVVIARIEDDHMIFVRLHTEEPIQTTIDLRPVTVWEIRNKLDLAVSLSTDFRTDLWGRIIFPMGRLGLATLYPSKINPKESLPLSLP